MTNAFLDFVLRCYEEGEGVLADAGVDITRRGNPIIVIYNSTSARIEYANPFV
jgi:hypothetical protein